MKSVDMTSGQVIDIGIEAHKRCCHPRKLWGDGQRWSTCVKLRERTTSGWWCQLGTYSDRLGAYSAMVNWVDKRAFIPNRVLDEGEPRGQVPLV